MRIRIIAGIDQSLNSTGIVIINAETSEILVSKAIVLNKNSKTPNLFGAERLIYIRDTIWELLKLHGAQFVVLEGYSFGSRGSSIFDLGEIGGAIRVLAHDLGLPFETIPPKTLKKYIAGNGNASKEEMAESILTKYGLTFGSNDEADALGLAFMAREIGPENLKEYCYKPKKNKIKKIKAKLIKQESGV
jgi:crossover junction endodeoxyribonuclease RuvC